MNHDHPPDPESLRLAEDARRDRNWKRWGTYLSDRQWGTVREDYSAHGTSWDYSPHEHARSRAYRWGEDGLLGICDRECRLCFALALWNGRDPILKERLFGLTNAEGNHGEDVKECYYFLDATPTYAYARALYKYPQAAFPYARLVEENRRRGKADPEFELLHTGIFNDNRYFDVFIEYAKDGPNDILVRVNACNRGPEPAELHLLPTLWFRNTWSWGWNYEGVWERPQLRKIGDGLVQAEHKSLGVFHWTMDHDGAGQTPALLFTENETNFPRVFGSKGPSPHVKDSFHEYVIEGRTDAINPAHVGTKAAAHYRVTIPASGEVVLRLRLFAQDEAPAEPFGAGFDHVMAARQREADVFYDHHIAPEVGTVEHAVIRQGYAGLLWTKQFYEYVVQEWLDGDPGQPPPPPERRLGRNSDWRHLFSRDVISMPAKWEYPWFASWDLAFQMIPFARIDPVFAKEQLILFLREWYMHPSGKIPAYEFAFDDANPPVHAWACWRIYKMTGAHGHRDRHFLARVFPKLLINFTWWVNRKDAQGKNLFSGGFLGLDNVSIFDRSQPLPDGGQLEQADGTAWMAFYCLTMLAMALELSRDDTAYSDVASKFFEHFIAIAHAINTLGGTGLWDDADGFYYDHLQADGFSMPTRIRSIAGLLPILAVEVLPDAIIDRLPQFRKRMQWFLTNRPEMAEHISYMERDGHAGKGRRLLAIPTRQRLERVLWRLLDESEFLAPYGIRSLSRAHRERPFSCRIGGQDLRIAYEPGNSTTSLFGGNSNWRGPIWLQMNYLVIEALERYHYFYGETFQVECPTGSGRYMTLANVAHEIAGRVSRLFLPDAVGRRPCHGDERRYADDSNWKEFVLFYEFFHGDTGQGLGASHQTGWTALVTQLLNDCCRRAAAQANSTEIRAAT